MYLDQVVGGTSLQVGINVAVHLLQQPTEAEAHQQRVVGVALFHHGGQLGAQALSGNKYNVESVENPAALHAPCSHAILSVAKTELMPTSGKCCRSFSSHFKTKTAEVLSPFSRHTAVACSGRGAGR